MGDVQMSISRYFKIIQDWINFRPHTSVEYGVAKFVEWYKNYYKSWINVIDLLKSPPKVYVFLLDFHSVLS